MHSRRHPVLQRRRPARAAEYDECVRRNLANPDVKAVHNLVEPHTVVPDKFKSHPKYRAQALPHWLRYSDAFASANAHVAGEVVCVCDLDIALDAEQANWEDAAAAVRNNIVLCLGRHEPADDVWALMGFARGMTITRTPSDMITCFDWRIMRKPAR